ncbi:hypothetical protein [Bacillus sp. 1P06AnD]|uniref:hypothetical protein n=1 Tax=Bacillus sp. 1P06AnD TaxID=3132208 RepID=UPI0039A178A0
MKKGLKIFLIVIGIFVGVSVLSYLFADDENKQKMEAEEAAGHVKQKESKSEHKEKNKSVEEQVTSDLKDKLGAKSNNKEKRIVSLEYTKTDGYLKLTVAGDNSLSKKDTKYAQLNLATKAFPILFKNKDVKKVMLRIQLPLVDTYGTKKNEDVVRIVLTRETNDKITWKNFDPNNFSEVAESYYVHLALGGAK